MKESEDLRVNSSVTTHSAIRLEIIWNWRGKNLDGARDPNLSAGQSGIVSTGQGPVLISTYLRQVDCEIIFRVYLESKNKFMSHQVMGMLWTALDYGKGILNLLFTLSGTHFNNAAALQLCFALLLGAPHRSGSVRKTQFSSSCHT